MQKDLWRNQLIWSQRVFFDGAKNRLSVVPIAPVRVPPHKYITPGGFKFDLRTPTKRTHFYVSARNLANLLAYDGVNPVKIFSKEQKMLKLGPKQGSKRSYHEICMMFDGSPINIWLWESDWKEIQVLLLGSLRWMYGFHFLRVVPQNGNFASEPHITHMFSRKNHDRLFAVNFNHCSMAGDSIKFGSMLLRFLEGDDYIFVGLTIQDAARLCTHDFTRKGYKIRFTTQLVGRDTRCTVSFDKQNGYYYFRAEELGKNICFRLDLLEFSHLAQLIEASIPVLTGFVYTFGDW